MDDNLTVYNENQDCDYIERVIDITKKLEKGLFDEGLDAVVRLHDDMQITLAIGDFIDVGNESIH